MTYRTSSAKFREMEWRRIGATLREFRESRGFTPDEFANEIGISRPYLSNIEAGRKGLTKILLARAATVLGVRQIAIAREDYYEEVA